MAVKTNGAEFKRFYNDQAFWPEDAWHEEEEIEVNGSPLLDDCCIEEIPDAATVKITGGVVLGLPNKGRGEGPSLEAHFKKWLRTQNTVSFVVACDKANLDALKVAIRAAGGSVA